MSSAKSAFSPLKFLTPGQLAICLVLFFMPWVEVQCGMPNLGNLGGNFGNPNAPPPKITAKDLNYTPIVTQSGFQAATGDYTLSDTMNGLMNQAKQMGGQVREEKKEKGRAAPVLYLFPAAALAGVVLGLVLPSGGPRKFVLVLCCGLVLASAGTQAVIGFPITEDVKKDPKFKEGDKEDLGGLKEEDIIRTVFKFPFYLALLFAAGGLVTAFIEPTRPAKFKKELYELDDEQDVEDDDPPDRDDDDRPRRRRPRPDDRE